MSDRIEAAAASTAEHTQKQASENLYSCVSHNFRDLDDNGTKIPNGVKVDELTDKQGLPTGEMRGSKSDGGVFYQTITNNNYYSHGFDKDGNDFGMGKFSMDLTTHSLVDKGSDEYKQVEARIDQLKKNLDVLPSCSF